MADPGFPRGGGRQLPGGAPTYDFAEFSQKLHEIERIWIPGGAPLDPPLLIEANLQVLFAVLHISSETFKVVCVKMPYGIVLKL